MTLDQNRASFFQSKIMICFCRLACTRRFGLGVALQLCNKMRVCTAVASGCY